MVSDMNEQMMDFERKAREVFESSVENLDSETRSRLKRAREAAVTASQWVRPPAWRAWAPAGAVAAALIAAVLWRAPVGQSPQVDVSGEAPIDLVELAAEGDDFELMTEDPEFYSWAASQNGNGSNGVG